MYAEILQGYAHLADVGASYAFKSHPIKDRSTQVQHMLHFSTYPSIPTLMLGFF